MFVLFTADLVNPDVHDIEGTRMESNMPDLVADSVPDPMHSSGKYCFNDICAQKLTIAITQQPFKIFT